MMAIMNADKNVGLATAFCHPGSERFEYREFAGIPCYLTHSTIGGSALFRVEVLQKLFKKLPVESVTQKHTWDWGTTSQVPKLGYLVATVRNTIAQHFIGGCHQYIAGNRFVGEDVDAWNKVYEKEEK